MAFDSKVQCLALKSLDGHETGRQATGLDENFGTPYSFDGDSETRGPEADLGLPKIENSTVQLFAKKNEKLNFRFWEGRNRPRDHDFRNLRQKL